MTRMSTTIRQRDDYAALVGDIDWQNVDELAREEHRSARHLQQIALDWAILAEVSPSELEGQLVGFVQQWRECTRLARP